MDRKEEMEDVFTKLTENNKEVLMMVAQGMKISQKEGEEK